MTHGNALISRSRGASFFLGFARPRGCAWCWRARDEDDVEEFDDDEEEEEDDVEEAEAANDAFDSPGW